MAIIYKILNNVNKKVYIGQTIRELNCRWNEHISESKIVGHGYKYPIHEAIRKYGVENFSIEVLEECTDEERYGRETFYIQKFNSLVPNGYNLVLEGTGRIQVPTGEILKMWGKGLSVKEIARSLDIHYSTVSHRLKNIGIQQEEIYARQGEQTRQRCSLKVNQYDLDGNFIKEWPSTTSCKEKGYEQSAISAVCCQKQFSAYGFLWKYTQDERSIEEWVIKNKQKNYGGRRKKIVLQFDLNNNFIQEFESGAAAAKSLGLKDKSGVCRAARLQTKAYGYLWKYKEDII